MNDYKAGDRVEYVGDTFTSHAGKHGSVIIDSFTRSSNVRVKLDDGNTIGAWPDSLRLVVAPDVITIDRADLPEVSALYEASHFPGKDVPRVALAVLLAGGWDAHDEAVGSLRSVIAGYEASIAQNVAEDAAAEKLAIDKRDKRRDELCQLLGSELIDHIIELEAEK